jgi:hypothetical protein
LKPWSVSGIPFAMQAKNLTHPNGMKALFVNGYSVIAAEHFGCYRQISKRFPFAVYYELEEQRVVVTPILDMRKKPNTIRNLVLERSTKHQSEPPTSVQLP